MTSQNNSLLSVDNESWFDQFLRENYASLAGKYYALGDHEIIAVAPTGDELKQQLRAKGNPPVIIGYCPPGTVVFSCD